MRALLLLVGTAACSSSSAELHSAVMVDVEVARTRIAVDGEQIDPGTANAGHGVDIAFDLTALDADTPHTVVATGAVAGTIVVPATPCPMLCRQASCDTDDIRFAWTQVEVTSTGLALGCVRCDGASGNQIAEQCP
jgi:hypothetical protein